MPDDIDRLIKKLGSSIWTDRSIAADSLIQLGNTSAVPALIKALRDAKEVVRSSAAEALGEFGDTRAVEPLCRLLADTNHAVSESAAESLVKLGAPSVGPLCKLLGDKREAVHKIATATLGKIGAPAIVMLINLLVDRDRRNRAARVLAIIGPPHELPQQILVSAKMSAQDRSTALNALHRLDKRISLQRPYYLEVDALQYCQAMALQIDPAVRKSAEEILRFLSLLRPGHSTGHDLLRAASGEEAGTSGDDLLRGAAVPSSAAPGRPSLLQRLRNVYKRFRREAGNEPPAV